VKQMRERLWDVLEKHGGMSIPIRRGDYQANERKSGG
jgi:hypothetical protein